MVHACKRLRGKYQPEIARCLNNLATLYSEQDQNSQAETLYQCALALSEPTPGPDHCTIAKIRKSYTAFLRKMHRDEEATLIA